MTTSRYWRLVGFRTRGGGDMELSALHLYDASGRADAASPPTCTASLVEGSIADLVDANPATVVRFAASDAASPGFAFDWDFGPDGKDIVYPRLGTGVVEARFPEAMLLMRSSDGVTWEASSSFDQYIYPGATQMTALPSPGGGPAGDPYFDDVVAFLRFDGAVGSNVITDETGRAWISEGATLSNTESLDGTPSLFVGSALGVSTPASADFNYGTGDATIEAWVFQTSRTGGGAIFGGIHYQNIVGQCQIGTGSSSTCNLTLGSGVPTAAFYSSSSDVGVSASNPIPLNTWVHLALVKNGNVVKLFVDGTPVTNTAFITAVDTSTRKLAVGMDSSNSAVFQGYIAGVRVTKYARYTSAFTPEVTLGGAMNWTAVLEAAKGHAAPIQYLPLQGLDTDGTQVWALDHHGLVRDMEHSGRGFIASTVKVKGTPTNTPLHRLVVLMHERSKLPIGWTWSDPITGNYRFEYIDEKETYSVVSYDHLHTYRAEMADNLTLANGGVELMP